MNIIRLIKMATVPSDAMLWKGWEGRLSRGQRRVPPISLPPPPRPQRHPIPSLTPFLPAFFLPFPALRADPQAFPSPALEGLTFALLYWRKLCHPSLGRSPALS